MPPEPRDLVPELAVEVELLGLRALGLARRLRRIRHDAIVAQCNEPGRRAEMNGERGGTKLRAVYMSLTTVRNGGPNVADTAKIAAESMLAWLREFDGYRGLVVTAEPQTETALIFTLWETREHAERSARGRAQVRESMVSAAGADLESVELFEVVLADRVSEPEEDA
jgi:heme-degrading monooxygenase HmoA